MSEKHNRIDYVELPVGQGSTHQAVRSFYGKAFGWVYQDWGDSYSDTPGGGISSGINSDAEHRTAAVLVLLYADNLEAARDSVLQAGGRVTREIFSFPGGRRFHFTDPAGNELGVWSDE